MPSLPRYFLLSSCFVASIDNIRHQIDLHLAQHIRNRICDSIDPTFRAGKIKSYRIRSGLADDERAAVAAEAKSWKSLQPLDTELGLKQRNDTGIIVIHPDHSVI